MNFSKALKYLKRGGKITRKPWVKDDSWLKLQVPKKSEPGQPYIKVITPNGDIRMWFPEHVDILAKDWVKRGWIKMKLLRFAQKLDQNKHERVQHGRTE